MHFRPVCSALMRRELQLSISTYWTGRWAGLQEGWVDCRTYQSGGGGGGEAGGEWFPFAAIPFSNFGRNGKVGEDFRRIRAEFFPVFAGF